LSMKIFETVTGSNQRLIQLQTVGKKDGAPIIWKVSVEEYHQRCLYAQIYDPMSLGNVP
jgi:hypothetical protein